MGVLKEAVPTRPGEPGWLINVIHRHLEKTVAEKLVMLLPG